MSEHTFPIGQRIALPGHFPDPVVLESVRPVGAGYECRVRLADAHNRHFAVRLSGIRTLPHPIEAMYLRMLPQPRLRFLLLHPDLFPEPRRVGDRTREMRRDILRLGPDGPWALRRLKEDLLDLQGRAPCYAAQ